MMIIIRRPILSAWVRFSLRRAKRVRGYHGLRTDFLPWPCQASPGRARPYLSDLLTFEPRKHVKTRCFDRPTRPNYVKSRLIRRTASLKHVKSRCLGRLARHPCELLRGNGAGMVGQPKVRTLCSKGKLERRPKSRTLCPKCQLKACWRAQILNPSLNMRAGTA